MPFPKQNPRRFTRANIEALNLNQKGCYGLYKMNQWIYVGRTDCIRKRLLEHLNGDNPCITRNKPTYWVDIVTNDNVRVEEQLILELTPTCNKKVG